MTMNYNALHELTDEGAEALIELLGPIYDKMNTDENRPDRDDPENDVLMMSFDLLLEGLGREGHFCS